MIPALLRRLRAALLELDPDRRRAELRWWQQRAQQYGPRAVYHRGHAPDELAEVDRKQKNLLYPILRSRLRGDERVVLDFGCGIGRFTTDLAGIVGGNAIGVDPTRALLDAVPRAENVEVHWIPHGRLPLPDASVDVVWICIVLTCITDPEALQAAIAEIRRVLKEDGLVFLVENTTPRPDLPHVAFRPVEVYRALFNFAPLRHETDYEDLGERISVMTGRKGAPADG